MKWKGLLISLILICRYSVLVGESSVPKKGNKNLKLSKTQDIQAVIFKAEELGKLWSIENKKDQLIYDPDSMRQASTYKKYIFSLKEFKRIGGDEKTNTKIYYRILDTETQNYTPDDPNLPYPSGGFTYITHKCKILKLVK